MDYDGERGSKTAPWTMQASMLNRRASKHGKRRSEPMRPRFEGFLSSSKSTALLKRSRKFQPEDRLLSLSSATSPAVRACSYAEEAAAGRDEGKSYYGTGRPKGGGYLANGQGKPKKGRAREAERLRHTTEPDFDYDDDPDVTF